MAGPAASSGQPLVLAVLEAVNPDLAPVCQVGEDECAGRAGVASLLFVESWPWCDTRGECHRPSVSNLRFLIPLWLPWPRFPRLQTGGHGVMFLTSSAVTF